MKACLGVYLGDKIIKYAKLIQEDKSKRISLASYGTKYIVGDKTTTIKDIINETGSTNAELYFNLNEYHRIQTEVLKQLGKNDVQSVVNLEVADYATSNGLNERVIEHREIFMDSLVSSDNFTADITLVDKANITKYTENKEIPMVSGIYPEEYVLNNLVKDNLNYLLINVDEKTQIISVVDGKVNRIVDVEVSMKNILDVIAEQEGSYDKACDICKSINVLSDESLNPSIERIVEPTIQDLLNRINTKIDELKIKYEKIYLNGLINLFINIDMLFEQFFGITTEKLKPAFINQQETSDNLAEIIEANEAIALAYEGIEGNNTSVNFKVSANNKLSFKDFFENAIGGKAKAQKGSKTIVLPNINEEKVERALNFANVTAGALLLGYVGFSAVYSAEMDNMTKDLSKQISNLQGLSSSVRLDISYIDENTKQYTTFNNYISDSVEKIREGKIGKYSTYNVANFMQKIAKYIPTNVQLESISSDDNKSVTIVATSTSYAELGYFISELKLKGILENIKTGKVETGTTIRVTIGGDLP